MEDPHLLVSSIKDVESLLKDRQMQGRLSNHHQKLWAVLPMLRSHRRKGSALHVLPARSHELSHW